MPYPSRRRAWTVVAMLIATAVLSYTDRQVLSLLVDPVRASLGIGDTQMSLLLGSAFAVVYGVAGIPLGLWADRTSRRNLIAAGVAVWSCGTVACGLSRNFGELFAARIVVGFGEAALSPAAISLISDYFPPSRRGTAVGLFLSGIAMGSGAAILIGGGVLHVMQSHAGLAGDAPWRAVFVAIGGPGLLWALAILAIREPARRAAEEAGGGDMPGARAALRVPTPWRAIAPVLGIVAGASLVDNAVGAWAPSLFIRDFGWEASRVGVALGAVITLGFGGGVIGGGLLADRAGARGGVVRKLACCVAGAVAIVAASGMLAAGRAGIVMAGLFLYFALSGAVTAIGFSSILDSVPNRARGLAMAVSFFLNVALGAGLGPTAVALASAHVFGAAAGLGPALVLTVAGVYGLVALAAAGAVWSKRRRAVSPMPVRRKLG